MCFLLKSRSGGKQATSSMRQRLYSDIKNSEVSKFHRHEDCSVRQRRDCAALKQTRQLLSHLVNLVTSSPR